MDMQDPFGDEVFHWYLIKWCSLPYDQATWETQASLEVDYEDEEEFQQKVAEFRRRNLMPVQRDPNYYKKCLPPGVRTPAGAWRKLVEAQGETEFKDGNTLRPYQTEGLNWLLYCWYHRQSCVLGDEMGLGKTVQSVSCASALHF
jgi:SNF2 family DNA or RNA helicase